AMISQYFSSSSTPMLFRPRFLAAMSVAPLPANGSAITPGGHLPINVSIRSIGFGVGCPMSLTWVPLPSFVVMTVLCGGDDLMNPSPKMYISSSFGRYVEFAGPGDAPALCQMRRCLVPMGRADLHEPNTTAGRLVHSLSASSLHAVELSFAIDLLGLFFGPSTRNVPHSPDNLIPYGGSVTRTSAPS